MATVDEDADPLPSAWEAAGVSLPTPRSSNADSAAKQGTAASTDTGVGVTVLMPGPTETNFVNRAEMLDTKIGASDSKDDPAMVAKAAYDALEFDRDKVTPTVKNKVLSAVTELLPDKAAAALHRGLSRPGPAG